MSDRRFMLAAPGSGSGKTLVTCGILEALKERGLRVSSFKCGPDYIDPMFHSKILGAKSRNLDTFFTEPEVTRFLLCEGSRDTDVSVMEGVMGYYDGLAGISTKASAYDLASVTETPVVLVMNTKGMSLSILAELKGFLSYREESGIQGVILNQMSPMMYGEIKRLIEEELSIRVFGYVPRLTDLVIESRHLGLVLPEEVEGLKENMKKLAKILEETVDLDGLLKLAGEAPPLEGTEFVEISRESAGKILDGAERGESGGTREEVNGAGRTKDQFGRPGREAAAEELPAILWNRFNDKERETIAKIQREAPVIAVSRDEAFCFLYEDNLRLLEKLGAEIRFFSPLHDAAVPEEADGCILCGGYPELFAGKLSENVSMRNSVRERIEGGFPCMAECGGFLYLHASMEDMEGREHEMAGAIREKAYRTGKLGRFGYVTLTPNRDGILGLCGEEIKAHEFHYFDSTGNGDSFHAGKPLRKRSWDCIFGNETQMMGFPHLYYYSNPKYAYGFLKAALNWKRERRKTQWNHH